MFPSERQYRLVVVADPVESTRELLREIFVSEFRAYVTTLEGASSLFNTAHEAKPDLIVLEVSRDHPGEAGVIRAIKSDPLIQDIPILGLNAWNPSLGCETILSLGCDACLNKPFTLDELVEKARELMGYGDSHTPA